MQLVFTEFEKSWITRNLQKLADYAKEKRDPSYKIFSSIVKKVNRNQNTIKLKGKERKTLHSALNVGIGALKGAIVKYKSKPDEYDQKYLINAEERLDNLERLKRKIL